MTAANRYQLTLCPELTLGVTPASPRMRTTRLTKQSLSIKPKFINSEELRADRMRFAPTKVNEENNGSEEFELSYPEEGSDKDFLFAGTMLSDWGNTPARFNDGIADSVITGVTGATKTVAVLTGPAFVAGHLVRTTGFALASNNGVRPVVTGSATAPILGGAAMADEPAPPGTARVKVVGFVGANGDINATATGLASTVLDFTTLGLTPYAHIKIGGAAIGNRFSATESGFARIVSISAHALELDDLPPGWGVDAGAGKQIYVFTSDLIRNGLTMKSFTLEGGFLGQTVPTFQAQRGMTIDQMDINITSEQQITGSFSFIGMTGEVSTVTLDATPDPATNRRVMSANVHVGTITDGSGPISGPNWIKNLKLSVKNNMRAKTALGSVGAVDLAEGECAVSGTMETYFGSMSTLQKLLAEEPGQFFIPITKDNQCIAFHIPYFTMTDGSPTITGKNTDVMLPLTWEASIHEQSNCHIQFERFEYVE